MNAPALPISVEAHEVADVESQLDAWNARCAVSHHEHFAPSRNASVSFHKLTVPRPQLRVALVSTGGVHAEGDAPFDARFWTRPSRGSIKRLSPTVCIDSR